MGLGKNCPDKFSIIVIERFLQRFDRLVVFGKLIIVISVRTIGVGVTPSASGRIFCSLCVLYRFFYRVAASCPT